MVEQNGKTPCDLCNERKREKNLCQVGKLKLCQECSEDLPICSKKALSDMLELSEASLFVFINEKKYVGHLFSVDMLSEQINKMVKIPS